MCNGRDEHCKDKYLHLPVDQNKYQLGLLALSTERYHEAIELFSELLSDSAPCDSRLDGASGPTIENVCIELAEATYRNAQYEKCAQFLKESICAKRISSSNPRLHHLRAWIAIWKGEYRKALEIGQYAQKNYIDESKADIVAKYYHLLGMCFYYLGDTGRATDFLRDAIGIFRYLNDSEGLASVYNAMGFVEKTCGKLDEAMVYYRKALKESSRTGMQRMRAYIQINISIVSLKHGDAPGAESMLHRIVLNTATGEQSRVNAHVFLSLARVEIYKRSYDSTINLTNKALAIATENGFLREESLALETLGDIAAALGKIETARRYYERAKSIGESLAPQGDIVAENMRRLASLRLLDGEAFEAVPLLKEAITVATKCGERFEIGIAYRHLAQAYRKLDQHLQAVKAARESVEIFTAMGAQLELAHSRLEAAHTCLAWYRTLSSSIIVGTAIENPNPYTHLESAWSHVIEAFHGYSDLEQEAELKECEKLMDELHGEGRPIWLRGSRKRTPGEQMLVNKKPFIANAPSMKQLIALVDVSASTTEPVLVTGETGTGKELIARLIHEKSDRANNTFLPVNCAAIPETLFEREFFGHARGAFTGADGERPGLCETADGGTMFLDEIGDMPAYLQVKLLRMIQEGTFHRLGDPAERHADLRIIAATNAPLPELIAAGTFRQDLYYRLQTLEMALPPLRERPEDLDPLMRLFVGKIIDGDVDPRKLFDRDVITVFERYPWPGNVRELEAMTRRLALMARHSGRATIEMLPENMRKWINMKPATTGSLHLGTYVEKVERERISQALLIKSGNRSEAARALGISRNQLYRKMDKFGIRMPV